MCLVSLLLFLLNIQVTISQFSNHTDRNCHVVTKTNMDAKNKSASLSVCKSEAYSHRELVPFTPDILSSRRKSTGAINSIH